MVTKLRRVETLITTVAGRASPLACRVKRTTNPATGQAAKMTVVISGTPVKPRHFKITIVRAGKTRLRNKIVAPKTGGTFRSARRIPAKLEPMMIIDSGVKAALA